MVNINILVFYRIGPCVVWLVNGCRTSYVEELAERYETWNSLVVLFLLGMLFGLAIYSNN